MAVDDFNRANSATLGANWTNCTPGPSFGTPIAISSNQAVTTAPTGSSDYLAYWNADTFGPDQFSQISMAAVPAPTFWIGLVVRCNSDGSQFYLAIFFNNGGNHEIRMYKWVSGFTQIGSTANTTFNASDILRVQVVGTTLTAYQNGVSMVSTTDGTYSSGSAGIAAAGAVTMDSWSSDALGLGSLGIQATSSITAPVTGPRLIKPAAIHATSTVQQLHPPIKVPDAWPLLVEVSASAFGLNDIAGFASVYGDGLYGDGPYGATTTPPSPFVLSLTDRSLAASEASHDLAATASTTVLGFEQNVDAGLSLTAKGGDLVVGARANPFSTTLRS